MKNENKSGFKELKKSVKENANFVNLTQLIVVCSNSVQREGMIEYFVTDLASAVLQHSNMGLKQFEQMNQFQQK